MANKVAPELSDKLFAQLQNESLVLLHTIDAEHGHPTSNAITWIYAPDKTTLRFALDKRSQIRENISQNDTVTITLFGDGKIHAVCGKAQIASEAMEGVPFWNDDERAAEKLDNQVFSALKKV